MGRSRGWKWLTLGVGLLAGVAGLLVGGFAWNTFRSYGHEFAIQQELDARFGAQATRLFEPDGALAEDRLDRFVAVRRDLQPLCEGVRAHQSAFSAVDEYRDRKPDKDEAADFLPRVLDAGRRMPAMVRGFTTYVTARNQALRQHGLGLSEYAAIYTLVYVSWLGERPSPLMSATRESVFERRVYPAVGVLVERFVSDPGPGEARTERLAPWTSEVEKLRLDPRRVPFADGLPPSLEAALRPRRPVLQALACPAAAELDVVRTEPRRVLGYDHR